MTQKARTILAFSLVGILYQPYQNLTPILLCILSNAGTSQFASF